MTTKSPTGLVIEDVRGVTYDPIDDRARIQGTGLEVFEVILIYHSVEKDWERLRVACDWLSDEQLRSALDFAEDNPAYIAARLAREAAIPVELKRLWRDHPVTRPPHR